MAASEGVGPSDLPELALQVVGFFLPQRSVISCRLVCRQWRTAFTACVDRLHVQVHLEPDLTRRQVAAATRAFPAATRATLLLPNCAFAPFNAFDSAGAATSRTALGRRSTAANAARREALRAAEGAPPGPTTAPAEGLEGTSAQLPAADTATQVPAMVPAAAADPGRDDAASLSEVAVVPDAPLGPPSRHYSRHGHHHRRNDDESEEGGVGSPGIAAPGGASQGSSVSPPTAPDLQELGRTACRAALEALRNHMPGLRSLQLGDARRPEPQPGPLAALVQCLNPVASSAAAVDVADLLLASNGGRGVAGLGGDCYWREVPDSEAHAADGGGVGAGAGSGGEGNAVAGGKPLAPGWRDSSAAVAAAAAVIDADACADAVRLNCIAYVAAAAAALASHWSYPATLVPAEGAVCWGTYQQEVVQAAAEQAIAAAHRSPMELAQLLLLLPTPLPPPPPPGPLYDSDLPTPDGEGGGGGARAAAPLVPPLPYLSSLDLRCAVDAAGLAHLAPSAAPQLTALTLLQIRDGSPLPALRQLPGLASLDLWCREGSSLTDLAYWTSAAPQRIRRGLTLLAASLTGLTSLVLRELAAQVEPPPPLAALAGGLPLLRSLTVELVYADPWRQLVELCEQLGDGEEEEEEEEWSEDGSEREESEDGSEREESEDASEEQSEAETEGESEEGGNSRHDGAIGDGREAELDGGRSIEQAPWRDQREGAVAPSLEPSAQPAPPPQQPRKGNAPPPPPQPQPPPPPQHNQQERHRHPPGQQGGPDDDERCIQRDVASLHCGRNLRQVVERGWGLLEEMQPMDLFSAFSAASGYAGRSGEGCTPGGADDPGGAAAEAAGAGGVAQGGVSGRSDVTRGSLTHLDVTFVGAGLLPGAWYGIKQLGASLTRLALRVGRSEAEESLVARLVALLPGRWRPDAFCVDSLDCMPHLTHLTLNAPLASHLADRLGRRLGHAGCRPPGAGPDLAPQHGQAVQAGPQRCPDPSQLAAHPDGSAPVDALLPRLRSLVLVGVTETLTAAATAAAATAIATAAAAATAVAVASSRAADASLSPASVATATSSSTAALPWPPVPPPPMGSCTARLRTLHLDGDLQSLISEPAAGPLALLAAVTAAAGGSVLTDLRLSHRPAGRPAARWLPLLWSQLPVCLEALQLEGFNIRGGEPPSRASPAGPLGRIGHSRTAVNQPGEPSAVQDLPPPSYGAEGAEADAVDAGAGGGGGAGAGDTDGLAALFGRLESLRLRHCCADLGALQRSPLTEVVVRGCWLLAERQDRPSSQRSCGRQDHGRPPPQPRPLSKPVCASQPPSGPRFMRHPTEGAAGVWTAASAAAADAAAEVGCAGEARQLQGCPLAAAAPWDAAAQLRLLGAQRWASRLLRLELQLAAPAPVPASMPLPGGGVRLGEPHGVIGAARAAPAPAPGPASEGRPEGAGGGAAAAAATTSVAGEGVLVGGSPRVNGAGVVLPTPPLCHVNGSGDFGANGDDGIGGEFGSLEHLSITWEVAALTGDGLGQAHHVLGNERTPCHTAAASGICNGSRGHRPARVHTAEAPSAAAANDDRDLRTHRGLPDSSGAASCWCLPARRVGLPPAAAAQWHLRLPGCLRSLELYLGDADQAHALQVEDMLWLLRMRGLRRLRLVLCVSESSGGGGTGPGTGPGTGGATGTVGGGEAGSTGGGGGEDRGAGRGAAEGPCVPGGAADAGKDCVGGPSGRNAASDGGGCGGSAGGAGAGEGRRTPCGAAAAPASAWVHSELADMLLTGLPYCQTKVVKIRVP